MKKLFIILLSAGLSTAAAAQHVHVGGGYYYARPHVTVVGGFYAPIYPYFGFGYGPFGYYPYGPYYGYSAPSKLTMQIEGIKSDYKDKIWSVKQDKSLTHAERKEKIHELKRERDQAIEDLKQNYYKH